MISPAEVRQAKAILAADRKAKRAARPKPVQPVAEGQRKPRVRDNAFLAFVRRQPCAVAWHNCSGPIEAAHIRMHKPGERPTGLQRKPDDTRVTPLCRQHHAEQHSFSEAGWWSAKGKDPFEIAARLYATFKGEGA